MSHDDATYEDALCRIRPCRLDAPLTRRLMVAIEDASATDREMDHAFEASIAVAKPAALPAGLKSRLSALADPVVGSMPTAEPARVMPIRRYAAAAAVAAVGAALALFAPIGGDDGRAQLTGANGDMTDDTALSSIAVDATRVDPGPAMDPRSFVPAAYQRGLSDARDEGVVWRDNAAHRVLRIVYMDTITLRNEAGETVEVEQPRVEYIVVPKKVD